MTGAHRRHLLLGAALIGSIAAAVWVRRSDEGPQVTEVAQKEDSVRMAKAGDETVPLLDTTRLGRRDPQGTQIDPFRTHNWYVPPPPPPPAPAPRPTAPPPAFRYMGQFEDVADGKPVVFLATASESFAVRPGDGFAGHYRFEGVEKGFVVVTFLPLDVRQRLPIPIPNE